MLSLIVSYGRRAAAQQEPVGSGALWQLEVSARQRILDQPSYLVLSARFRGEERPYGHLVADALRSSVMGRQRARRLVVPMSAQRNGYRTAGGAGIPAGIEDDDGVVGVGGAGHVRGAARP